MRLCILLLGVSIQASLAATPLERLAALKPAQAEVTELRQEPALSPAAAEAAGREPQPARTWFKLLLHPAAGSNIRVEICLPEPDQWNGRLLGLGNGGPAGRINSPSLAGYAGAGYAVASTDMGTAPDPTSGIDNREVWKDFGYRATHLMTVVARQSVQAFYERAPQFSYFIGASTGGQQGLQEAQRFPEDYDGIIANVPAHCRVPLHAYFLWNDQILKARPFTAAQEAKVISAANEYMARGDQSPVAEQFVADPRCTPADIDKVIALAQQKDPTLSPAHAAALRKLFTGPVHATTGERIFNGVPLGASIGAAHGHLYLWKWVFGSDQDLQRLDFGADLDRYSAALAPFLNAENADLRAFARRGGKLLITTGTADSVVPPQATIGLYERMAEQQGGLSALQAFCLLYVVPGLDHPGLEHDRGPGVNTPPNLFDALRAWREDGQVPPAQVGRRMVEGKVLWEMPLFPYPMRPVWNTARQKWEPVEGPRGGVEQVAARFRPPAQE